MQHEFIGLLQGVENDLRANGGYDCLRKGGLLAAKENPDELSVWNLILVA